jgi:hypothetical protein
VLCPSVVCLHVVKMYFPDFFPACPVHNHSNFMPLVANYFPGLSAPALPTSSPVLHLFIAQLYGSNSTPNPLWSFKMVPNHFVSCRFHDLFPCAFCKRFADVHFNEWCWFKMLVGLWVQNEIKSLFVRFLFYLIGVVYILLVYNTHYAYVCVRGCGVKFHCDTQIQP